MAFVAAGFYALYIVIMKFYLKDDDKIDMILFFVFMGIFNFVGYGVVLIVICVLNGLSNLFFVFIERVFWFACVKVFFDNVFSDYFWVCVVLFMFFMVVLIGLLF